MNSQVQQKLPRPEFSYDSFDLESATKLRATTSDIHELNRTTSPIVFQLGERLATAKAIVGHGKWGAYLKYEFGWHERTAQRYVAVHETLGDKSDMMSVLEPTSLYKLSAPSTAASVRDQVLARLKSGEKPGVAEIEQLIRDERASRLPPGEPGLAAESAPPAARQSNLGSLSSGEPQSDTMSPSGGEPPVCAELQSDTELQPSAEPLSEAGPQSDTEPLASAEPPSRAEMQPIAELLSSTEPKPDDGAKSGAEPSSSAELQPNTEPLSEAGPQSDTESLSSPEPKLGAEPETGAELKPSPERKLSAKSKSDAGPEPSDDRMTHANPRPLLSKQAPEEDATLSNEDDYPEGWNPEEAEEIAAQIIVDAMIGDIGALQIILDHVEPHRFVKVLKLACSLVIKC